MVWNMKMKALCNFLQGEVVKNVSLNKNQSAIMVQKLPVISLLLVISSIDKKIQMHNQIID
jgi:hypothetical protein